MSYKTNVSVRKNDWVRFGQGMGEWMVGVVEIVKLMPFPGFGSSRFRPITLYENQIVTSN